MEKKSFIMKNKKKIWVQNLKWATAHLSRRLGARQAQGARGACVGSAGARWARALGASRQAWQACVGAGRGAQASVRGRAGRRRQAAAARKRSRRMRARQLGAGAGAGGRQGAARAAGRALGARQAGAGRAGRAAWAPGLALGSALGALGPFSIRFDSFFFFLSHQMNTVHCKIKFFRKKKYLLNSNKIK